jgi:hypothetical protein
LPAIAPIVVSGEDAFQETSHVERMVLVNLPRDGRNVEALRVLREPDVCTGFGRSYLTWLVEHLRAGTIPAPVEVLDRPRHSRAVAEWGWDLFNAFVREVTGTELDVEFDDTLIRQAHERTSSRPVVIEALRELLGRVNQQHESVVWAEGADVLVRLHPFVIFAKSALSLVLPGNPESTRRELEQRFDVQPELTPYLGPALRLHNAYAIVMGDSSSERTSS